MSIMGMRVDYYFVTWFIRSWSVLLAIHLVASGLLMIVLTQSSYGMVLLVFVLFDVVLVLQAQFIQMFFASRQTGIISSAFFFVIQYLLAMSITFESNATYTANLVISIVPHAAIMLFFRTLLYSESVNATIGFVD